MQNRLSYYCMPDYNGNFFLDNSIQGGKVQLTLCEAPTHKTRPDHNSGNYVPFSFMVVLSTINNRSTETNNSKFYSWVSWYAFSPFPTPNNVDFFISQMVQTIAPTQHWTQGDWGYQRINARCNVVYSLWYFFSWTILSMGEKCNEVYSMQSTNPWGKARPQHWELPALLFSISS